MNRAIILVGLPAAQIQNVCYIILHTCGGDIDFGIELMIAIYKQHFKYYDWNIYGKKCVVYLFIIWIHNYKFKKMYILKSWYFYSK